MKPSRLINRNIRIDGARTSVRLEPEFWDALQDVAMKRGVVVSTLVNEIRQQSSDVQLTSSIRVWLLQERALNGNAKEHTGKSARK